MSASVLRSLGDDRRLRIIVCCGTGGVGKTTLSAAMALQAAESGRHVALITVDPARRLAQALGLDALSALPRPVPGVDASTGGSLHAMMLDPKRTFDAAVRTHATAERARQLFANPFYRAVSTSLSGTQEYMAMEELSQLTAAQTYDLVVVDTPPSRSALDFLDAPNRLAALLDRHVLSLLAATSSGPLRLLGAGVSMASVVLARLLGSTALADLQTFAAAFESVTVGFHDRAQATRRLLASPQTAFVVVATPQSLPLREAQYFAERLHAERMPLRAVVINRLRSAPLNLSAETARQLAHEQPAGTAARAALLTHANLVDGVAAERALVRQPWLDDHPVAYVPDSFDDVADLFLLRLLLLPVSTSLHE